MDGASLLSSPSSSVEEESSPHSTALLQTPQEHGSTVKAGVEEVIPVGERLLSGEEHVTLITESMSVTSSDQEKVLLLNRNTELRRVNKELMKLNEDWDHVYRSTTLNLQQRVECLEQENTAVKELNNRLLLKVEHEQRAREYYEDTLMQELKKNLRLQEYIKLIENRLHNTDNAREWTVGTQTILTPEPSPPSDAPGGPTPSSSLSPVHGPPPNLSSRYTPERKARGRSQSSSAPCRAPEERADTQREVQDLKDQMEALRCQTQIYEVDYQTEHKDHKNTLQENRRLRRKREEMRQQMALLQEQLKVYEDDFRKERSDKQVLQRLLLKKTPPVKDPVLVHRCNNEQRPPGGDRRTQREEQGGAQQHQQLQPQQHHPFCPKKCERQTSEEFS